MKKLIILLTLLFLYAGCDTDGIDYKGRIAKEIYVGNKFNYDKIKYFSDNGHREFKLLFINHEYTEYSIELGVFDYYAVRVNNKDSIIFNIYKYK